MLNRLASLLQDPPPALACELSEAGIAVARTSPEVAIDFYPLEPGVLSVSPVHDNILRPEEFSRVVRSLAPVNGNRKRRDMALILPDDSARVAVLDFDKFPGDPKEQASLVRFRMKKAVPFDIEAATVSFWPQRGQGGKVDVAAVVTPREIVARYEAPFREAGLNPGLVTTSSLAALELVGAPGVAVLAKVTGRTLSVLVLESGALKLMRCLELERASLPEISAELYPTFVYVEDNLGAKARQLILCGFGAIMDKARQRFQDELGLEVEPLRSAHGVAGEHNAGLLGWVQSLARPALRASAGGREP
ncbi:MAG: hypothetical protein FJW37_13510 [Acidobacteria bacterium]|nr:hypothetical protein [Acidobacteriota bacterium]